MNILQLLQRAREDVFPANAAQGKVDLRTAGQHVRHNHRATRPHQPQRALQKNRRIGVIEIFENPQRVDQFGLMVTQLQQEILITHQGMHQIASEQSQLFTRGQPFLRRHGFRPAQSNRIFIHQREIHLLTVELRITQRLQYRDGGTARQADPVIFTFVVNVFLHQRGQHAGAGSHADGIVGMDKPLAAVAVHFCAFGETVFQRILHHKQRQRSGDKPGAPGFQRRAVAVSLLRITVLRNKHRLPSFFEFNQRRSQCRIGFQRPIKRSDLPCSIVLHRPLVADVGK